MAFTVPGGDVTVERLSEDRSNHSGAAAHWAAGVFVLPSCRGGAGSHLGHFMVSVGAIFEYAEAAAQCGQGTTATSICDITLLWQHANAELSGWPSYVLPAAMSAAFGSVCVGGRPKVTRVQSAAPERPFCASKGLYISAKMAGVGFDAHPLTRDFAAWRRALFPAHVNVKMSPPRPQPASKPIHDSVACAEW